MILLLIPLNKSILNQQFIYCDLQNDETEGSEDFWTDGAW